MMNKAKIILIIIILVVSSLIFFDITSGAVQPTIFRLGHVCELTHPYNLGAIRFADLVNERTNGRYKIEIYPARQLGGDRELFEAIKMGTLDMGNISWGVVGGFTPVANALQLPWLIDTSYDFQRALQSSDVLRKLMDWVEEDCQVRVLSICFGGVRHFSSNDGPVETPEDLKGLKYRVMESPLHFDIFRALEVNPTPLPYGDIYMSLKTGVIDGHEHNIAGIVAMKFYEVAKYLTLSGHFTFPVSFIMSQQAWDSLSPEDQKIFFDSAKEAHLYELDIEEAVEGAGITALINKGMIVNKITDLKPFMKKVEGVYDKYEAEDSRIIEFIEGVEKLKEDLDI